MELGVGINRVGQKISICRALQSNRVDLTKAYRTHS